MRERDEHQDRQRRSGRDLNSMPPCVVHDIRVNPNGSVHVYSSSVSFEGYVGGGPSGRISEADPLTRLGLTRSEK